MSLGPCQKCGGTLCVSSGPVGKEFPDGRREVTRVTQVLCELCQAIQPDHPLLAEIEAAARVPPPRPAETNPIDHAPGYGDRILALERKHELAEQRLAALEKSVRSQPRK